MVRSRPWGAYFHLTAAMIIVGSSVAVGKVVADSFPVFLASAMRYAIGAATLLPILWLREGRPRGLSLRDAAVLVVQAACGTLVFSALLLYGLRSTTAAEGGVVAGVLPALVGAFSVALLGERMTGRRIVATGLAVTGLVALNIGVEDAGRGTNPLIGDLLVLGAISGEALFVILGKKLRIRRSPLFIATAMSVLGTVLFLPPAMVEAAAFDFGAVTLANWLVIAYYGVGVTAVAFLLWFSGVAGVPGTTAGVFTAVMPVAALGFSYLWLGEEMRYGHIAGLFAVLAAIVLAALGRPSRRH